MSKSLSGLNEGIYDALVSSSILTADGHDVVGHSKLAKASMLPDFESQIVNDIHVTTISNDAKLRSMNLTNIPSMIDHTNQREDQGRPSNSVGIPDVQTERTEFVDTKTFQTNIPPILSADLTVDKLVLLRTEIPNIVQDGLDGKDGDHGDDGNDGANGSDGVNGQSAYEL